jgi:hypothetical protein
MVVQVFFIVESADITKNHKKNAKNHKTSQKNTKNHQISLCWRKKRVFFSGLVKLTAELWLPAAQVCVRA